MKQPVRTKNTSRLPPLERVPLLKGGIGSGFVDFDSPYAHVLRTIHAHGTGTAKTVIREGELPNTVNATLARLRDAKLLFVVGHDGRNAIHALQPRRGPAPDPGGPLPPNSIWQWRGVCSVGDAR